VFGRDELNMEHLHTTFSLMDMGKIQASQRKFNRESINFVESVLMVRLELIAWLLCRFDMAILETSGVEPGTERRVGCFFI
jgi:hypothetical protein